MKNSRILTEKMANHKPKSVVVDFLALANELLCDESDRAQEITRKRFGLGYKKAYTLEQIGHEYGITRERVRQIVFDTLRRLRKKGQLPAFQKAIENILLALQKNDGIMKEKDIASILGEKQDLQINAVVFFGSLISNISIVEDKGILEKSWVVNNKTLEEVKSVFQIAEKFLNQKKSLASDKAIAEAVIKNLPALEESKVVNYLSVSNRIKKNPFDQWGLFNWSEINPKGTRERIYLVLKEKKAPMHFQQIAETINAFNLGKRQAHPQTVHNELIKDKRFVLIGRGIYALKEWGYEAGTIREVIESILKKTNHGLSKEEVVSEVLKVRKVKQATIMINLNNRKFFSKKDNLYRIK